MRYLATEYMAKQATFYDHGRPVSAALPGRVLDAWANSPVFRDHVLKHVGAVPAHQRVDALASHYAIREHLLAGAGQHLGQFRPADLLAVRPVVPPDVAARFREIAGPASLSPYQAPLGPGADRHLSRNVDYPELRLRHGVIQPGTSWPATLTVHHRDLSDPGAPSVPVSADQRRRRLAMDALIQQVRSDPAALAGMHMKPVELDSLDLLHAQQAKALAKPTMAPPRPRAFAPRDLRKP